MLGKEKIKINPQHTTVKRKMGLLSKIGLSEEKKYLVENLSILLESGMNILDALKAIKVELRIVSMKHMVRGLEDDINNGSTLSKALASTNLFSPYVISLIDIGERSGRLSENLKVINLQQKKEDLIRSKVRSAMLYPIFVLFFTLLVTIFISWFVLPKLSSVFSSLNVELPYITRLIINAGNFVNENGINLIPLVTILFFIIIYFIFFFKKTRFIGESFLFHIPIVKDFIKQVQLSRFGFILGTLFEAGLSINEAIDALIFSTTFKKYKNFYIYLRASVDDGNSFQKSFKEYPAIKKLMPMPIQQIIVAGEQSGRLSGSLIKIAENYESKMDNTAKNMSVMLEPILLILVGLGVATVAIGVILPIYSLMDGINNPNNTMVNDTRAINNESPVGEKTKIIEESVVDRFFLEIINSEGANVDVFNVPNGGVVGQLNIGETFELLEQDNEWVRVALPDGENVWLRAKYADIKKQK